MILFKKAVDLAKYLKTTPHQGMVTGFVPTMGALHEGHISLINRAKMENDLVACSIFVNPAQFNDKKDLVNYPRTPEADYAMLSNSGCDLLFEPSEAEIYPSETGFTMDFGSMERVMEGQFRPGHFKGVAKVVSRLFQIVKPDKAYFGEKDFQQLAIIKELVRRKDLRVGIVGCPTLRDERGLALSSRNIHLSVDEFNAAPVIFETLQKAKASILQDGIAEGKEKLISMIENSGLFKVQYLDFVDSYSLLPIEDYDSARQQRVCTAVLTSKTRLIDNAAL